MLSSQLTITFDHENVPTTLPPELALSVFRIVQEALQNVLKHSRAKTVSVQLRGSSHGLDLTVADDGVGFAVETAGRQGLGLTSMGERVEAMGGRFNVLSSPDRGTKLTVSMPVPRSERSGASPGEARKPTERMRG